MEMVELEGEKSTKKRKMTIMEVLSQGQKLAQQLQKHLDDPSDKRDYLISKILSTYEEAINVADSQPCDQVASHGQLELINQQRSRPSRKRKSLPRWEKKVKVESVTEQGSLNDGFNWRKYGQKDIHGAAFPRSYLRCSHLHSQGCIATKQIQKSNEDPTILHVIYRGHHTCTQPLTYQDTPLVHEPIKAELVTEQVQAPPEESEGVEAEEGFAFQCFSFSSTAPFQETEVVNEWEASPSSNKLRSSASGFNQQGDWPELSMEDLAIFDPELFS